MFYQGGERSLSKTTLILVFAKLYATRSLIIVCVYHA